jgi:hypothetical protein
MRNRYSVDKIFKFENEELVQHGGAYTENICIRTYQYLFVWIAKRGAYGDNLNTRTCQYLFV